MLGPASKLGVPLLLQLVGLAQFPVSTVTLYRPSAASLDEDCQDLLINLFKAYCLVLLSDVGCRMQLDVGQCQYSILGQHILVGRIGYCLIRDHVSARFAKACNISLSSVTPPLYSVSCNLANAAALNAAIAGLPPGGAPAAGPAVFALTPGLANPGQSWNYSSSCN